MSKSIIASTKKWGLHIGWGSLTKRNTTKTPTKMKWFFVPCHSDFGESRFMDPKTLEIRLWGDPGFTTFSPSSPFFSTTFPFRWIIPGSLTARPWKITIPRGKACLPTIFFCSGAMLNFGAVSFEVFADRLKCILIVDFSFIAQAVCFAAEVLTVFFSFTCLKKFEKWSFRSIQQESLPKHILYLYILYESIPCIESTPPRMQSFSKYRFFGAVGIFTWSLLHQPARDAGGLVNLATLPQWVRGPHGVNPDSPPTWEKTWGGALRKSCWSLKEYELFGDANTKLWHVSCFMFFLFGWGLTYILFT